MHTVHYRQSVLGPLGCDAAETGNLTTSESLAMVDCPQCLKGRRSLQVHPDVTLSTGLLVTHRFLANGAQEALCDGEMSEAEWEEYCEVRRGVR